MKKEVLQDVAIGLPITGLILFVVLFLGLVTWVLLKENKRKFKDASLVPFDEGESNERK